MELSQPPLIRIYQSCEVLMTIKRKLFQSLNIDSLPHSPVNEEKRTISSRVYLYLKKLTKQMKNQLAELSYGPNKQSHIEIVNKVITNLKNHNEFLSQEEKLIMEANKTIEEWQAVQDPLIFYQQNQRSELKKSLSSKLSEINTFSVACRETKKPLYVRKLQRQLKDNLCIIAQNEMKYNFNQYSLAVNIRKKVIKLLMKLLESATTKDKTSFVEVQKNMLLSRYIDTFHGKQGKTTSNKLIQYRKDLSKTIQNIRTYFQEEELSFETLLSYMNSVQSTIKTFHRQVLDAEDSITDHILSISSDVNYIVNFEDTLEIINNTKGFFFSLLEWNEFKEKISKMKIHIQDAMNLLDEHSRNISKRKLGESKNQEVSQFIQDKKLLQLISKKQQTFEFSMFEELGLFFQKLYNNRNTLNFKCMERDEVKKFKFQKALTNIFQNYFKELQTSQKSFDGKSSNYQTYKLSLNQQNQIKKIEEFIQSLKVFDDEEVNWKDSYQCSLGPRLLIHGKMKILPEGILYISNFNKKNYFFGKTKIFIPKEDIFEINKQSALVIFPDVIEVITKKKGVYFHALGKRERMVEELNEMYFPQVNETDQPEQELLFNQFKGNIDITENRLKPYAQNLEYFIDEGDFPNLNLRRYFQKYESEEEFHYQGKTYPTFKEFSIELAGGTNTQRAKFTPGIPYYMEMKNKTGSEINQDIQETQRFFTYKKEVPMIPFVSKGGHGICQEKTVIRWGGPRIFVVDIYTTLSGFSLTEGMLVRARQIFQEKINGVHYQCSGEVTFETNSALNNMLRAPALSNLKGFMLQLFQVIKKIEKIRKPKKIGTYKMLPDDDEQNSRIIELEKENARLKKIMLRGGIVALIIYIFTIFFLIFY